MHIISMFKENDEVMVLANILGNICKMTKEEYVDLCQTIAEEYN